MEGKRIYEGKGGRRTFDHKWGSTNGINSRVYPARRRGVEEVNPCPNGKNKFLVERTRRANSGGRLASSLPRPMMKKKEGLNKTVGGGEKKGGER